MRAGTSKVERRNVVRRIVDREFTTAEEFIREYVSTVSRGGAFIRSDDPLPVGTKVNLQCTVIVDELETIEGLGEVVRVVPPGSDVPPGMGVAFLELTSHSRQLVERILVHR